MNTFTFKQMKDQFDLAKIEFEAFEGYDTKLKKNVLVISLWETAHTNTEMVFDMNGKYLYTEKHNDWDYIK